MDYRFCLKIKNAVNLTVHRLLCRAFCRFWQLFSRPSLVLLITLTGRTIFLQITASRVRVKLCCCTVDYSSNDAGESRRVSHGPPTYPDIYSNLRHDGNQKPAALIRASQKSPASANSGSIVQEFSRGTTTRNKKVFFG